jgi:hypothetical protein
MRRIYNFITTTVNIKTLKSVTSYGICCAPALYVTSFENGYPATVELVRCAVSEDRVCNSCTTCILHIFSHGTTQPSEIVCKMHVAQLLQTFFANCRIHKLLFFGVAIFRTSGN